MKLFKFTFLALVLFMGTAFTTYDHGTDPKSKALIEALYEVNGGWNKIASMKDVQYTYVYNDFSKGIDMSTERYIFDGEASWGKYTQHEANVMPGKEGVAIQCHANGTSKMSLAGENITDPAALGLTTFLRPANYYWFAMMYKLDDPGTHHKYLGQEVVNGINYDKVALTYSAAEVGKEVNDEYVLFFNPETHLVDQFLFSIPALGIAQPVLRMDLKYEKIQGVYIATERKAYAPNEKGEYNQMGEYTSKNIKFNNNFGMDDLKI